MNVSSSIPTAKANPNCTSSEISPAISEPSVAAMISPAELMIPPVLTMAIRAASRMPARCDSSASRAARKML